MNPWTTDRTRVPASPRLITVTGLAAVMLLGCGCAQAPADPLPPTIAELDRARAQRTAGAVHGGEARSGPTALDAPRVVVAFVLGERGDVLPCECPDGASGGVARRAAFVEELDRIAGPVLGIAGPGTLAPHPDLDGAVLSGVERAVWLRDVTIDAGADVIALGIGDLLDLDPDALQQLVDTSTVDVVATNLVREDGGPIAPVAISMNSDTPRVAVLSLSEPRMAPPGYRIEAPDVATRRALASLESPPDVVISLWDSERPVTAESIATLDGVDFVIGSSGREGRDEVIAGADRHIVRAAPGTTRVGLLELRFTGGEGATFVDDRQLRHVLKQRLLALAALVRGAGDLGRLGQLDGDLDGVTPAGHVYGVQSVPLTAEYPVDEGILAAVERFYGGAAVIR